MAAGALVGWDSGPFRLILGGVCCGVHMWVGARGQITTEMCELAPLFFVFWVFFFLKEKRNKYAQISAETCLLSKKIRS